MGTARNLIRFDWALKRLLRIVYFELGQGEDYVYHGINEFMGIHKNDILQLSAKQKDIFGKEQISERRTAQSL